MALNLEKGQKINLTNGGDKSFRHVMVGLGWDEAIPVQRNGFLGSLTSSQQQQTIDCDASVILCGENGKIVSDKVEEYCVSFRNLKHSSGAIIHHGDNLTGEGDGDDEQIQVDLQNVPSDIAKMVFVVNIYAARERRQHFGMIRNAFIRLVDMDTNEEICRFNLSGDYSDMTGLVVGEIYRKDGEWKFNATGQPVREASRLESLIKLYK